jgi:rSAM/selenodomain-associated transferase 2
VTNSVLIVIPTLNEEVVLYETLSSLEATLGTSVRIVVADGGSEDRTRQIAENFGALVVQTPAGRGNQMQAGAKLGNEGVLWFLHADAQPSPSAIAAILQVLENPKVIGGHLNPQFVGMDWGCRWMNWFYPTIAKLGWIYGDAGFFVRRSSFEKVGGFTNDPLFEDAQLATRLRKIGKFVALPHNIYLSNRRWKGRSFCAVFSRWLSLQMMFWLGVSPQTLIRWYPPVR